MRLGRVEYTVGYTVDLDNEKMVQHARDAIIEDIISVVFQQGSEAVLAGIASREDASLSPSDIATFLTENEEED